MPRVKYPNDIYLQRQRSAMQNAQVLSNRDMAIKLGVTAVMYRRYLAGLTPLQDDLLYIRSMADVDIAVFARNMKKEIWSL
jgi:hypothetical protein